MLVQAFNGFLVHAQKPTGCDQCVVVERTVHAHGSGTYLARIMPGRDDARVGLLDRLRRLDSDSFDYLRKPDERAEAYLRRVAAWRTTGIGQIAAVDVHTALGEYFRQLDRASD